MPLPLKDKTRRKQGSNKKSCSTKNAKWLGNTFAFLLMTEVDFLEMDN